MEVLGCEEIDFSRQCTAPKALFDSSDCETGDVPSLRSEYCPRQKNSQGLK